MDTLHKLVIWMLGKVEVSSS